MINKAQMDFNSEQLVYEAEKRAEEMRKDPSPLEKRMQDFLKRQSSTFEFQKPIYITTTAGEINRYYIADFYLPDKNIIIETDGNFHNSQKVYDMERTLNIQLQMPDTTLVRWTSRDFKKQESIKNLVELIK